MVKLTYTLLLHIVTGPTDTAWSCWFFRFDKKKKRERNVWQHLMIRLVTKADLELQLNYSQVVTLQLNW